MSNKVVKIIGKVESGERFLRLALYQVRIRTPLGAQPFSDWGLGGGEWACTMGLGLVGQLGVGSLFLH